MRIYDGLYTWDGWGGKMRLASGRCRLRLFDLKKGSEGEVTHLKRFVAVVSDIPFGKQGPNQLTVKSCASHIATNVVRNFSIEPGRMLWIEHYPGDSENEKLRYPVKEHFDEAEFSWDEGGAKNARWKTPSPATVELVKKLLET
ncbi:MAG: hypothetical protein AB7S75_23250 [Desulfococcaceae bacterium]